MNFLQRITSRFAAKREAGLISMQLVSPYEQNLFEKYQPFNYKQFTKEGFCQNVVIYGCVMVRANTIIEAPLKVWRKDADDNLVQAKDKTALDLQRLLNTPNPGESQREFMLRYSIYNDTAGDVYIWKRRAASRRVVQLVHLRPDRVKIGRVDMEGEPIEYIYSPDGTLKQPIPAEDIIHLIDTPHPTNDYYGMSPLHVVQRETQLDNHSVDYMQAFFMNGAAASFLISTKTPIVNEEQAELIRQKIADRQSGKFGWFRPWLIDGTDVTITKIGSNVNELDMDKIFSHTESRICVAYGVPTMVLGAAVGIASSTHSNYEEAEKRFITKTITQEWQMIGDGLTRGLASEFGEDLIIAYDLSKVTALQENQKDKRDHYRGCWNDNLITRNEARVGLGFEELDAEQGDLFKQESNPIAMEMADQVDDDEQEQKQPFPKKKFRKESFAISRKQWRVIHAIADAAEPKMRKAILRVIAETQGATVVSEVEAALAVGNTDAAINAIPWDKMSNDLKKSIERQIWDTTIKAAVASEATLPFDYSFDKTNPRSIQWARDYSAKLVTGIDEVSRQAIREIITRGFEEGIDVREMARNIRDYIGLTPQYANALDKYRKELVDKGDTNVQRKVDTKYSQYLNKRARMISRTETITAANRGQEDLWNSAVQDGLLTEAKTKRKWIATPDDRLDPICADLDGAEVGLNEMFDGGVIGPPIHPQCRCTTGLVFER